MLKFEQIKYRETKPKCIDFASDNSYVQNYSSGKIIKKYTCCNWTECKNYNFDLCHRIRRQQ